ncbi:MAG: LuxR C-terminal-related transcriptional regulator [Parachlamydia sp.]|nr:LuxR C-terminal-related transcriptional regulator [Parachlamydia sp.]
MLSFSKFNEKFSERHHKKLKNICEPLFTSLGLNSFYYQTINKNGNLCSICTEPELMDYYFVEHKMYQHNPFITQFSEINSGIYFHQSVQDDDFQSTAKSLQDKFEISFSCLFTRKTDDICHEFGFGRSPERSNIDLLIINNVGIINSFIDYFESEMRSVIHDMHHNPISLKNDPSLYQKPKGILASVDLDRSKKLAFIKKIAPEHFYEGIDRLTKRERACIRHILKGKSASQIAAELYLSERTVEGYVENIKNKLGCHSKQKLIEILQIYSGLHLI